jgi:succinate dehydrogenase / fumarate reductase cytochrome b subunit
MCLRAFRGTLLVKDTRPVNLDIGTMKLPITAYASILHRISGVFLFIVIGLMIYALDLSLSSQAEFDRLASMLSSPVAKLILWAVLAGLIYHSVAGVKHLVMDMGYGETFEGGVLGSRITFVVSAILIALAGVWVW